MKVGDLVRDIRTSILGIIIEVNDSKVPLDLMFPYHVHFIDGEVDWFGSTCLVLISESR